MLLVAFSAAGSTTTALAEVKPDAGTVPGVKSAKPASNSKPKLEAKAWAMIDARSGDILEQSHGRDKLLIASTTKLMTAYLAFKELPLRRKVEAVPYTAIPGESLMGLISGQKVSVRDLLYWLILESGNDAAATLAVAAAGSEHAFVRQMNKRAMALGLADTHYENPIGLDAKDNYSSAIDLTTLGRRLMKIPYFRKIAGSQTAELTSFSPPVEIETRNTLLGQAPWVTGIKTGHTIKAGFVLVGSGQKEGVDLITAVIGAPSESERDAESLELLEDGFSLYKSYVPVRRGRVMARPEVQYTDDLLPLRAARTVRIGVRKGQRLKVEIGAPEQVDGPIRKGDGIGQVSVAVDGREVASVPLLATRDISKASVFQKVISFLGIAIWLIPILLFVILIAALRLRRRRPGPRKSEEEMHTSRERRQSLREQRRRNQGDGESG